MRWTLRGAHLMLKVRFAVMNGTLERDQLVADRRPCCLYRRAESRPRFETVPVPVDRDIW
jgi:hypothetical protein